MPANTPAVVINGHTLSADQLTQLQALAGGRVPAGRYWYDAVCGAWGVEHGPALGFGPAGLALPGPPPVDISGRGTGIFINGREIHAQEQQALQALFGTTVPGRYTLDALGNLAVENGPFLANLKQAAAPKSGIVYSRFGTTVVDGEGAMFSSRSTGFYSTT